MNCTAVLAPSTACNWGTSTDDQGRCDVLSDSVSTEIDWNISPDFRELCARRIKESFNERNAALSVLLTLATWNYEPINVLDISVQPGGIKNRQASGAWFSAFSAWFCFWRQICYPLKWKEKFPPMFKFFSMQSTGFVGSNTLSQETFKNQFKQTPRATHQESCPAYTVCPYPCELSSRGAVVVLLSAPFKTPRCSPPEGTAFVLHRQTCHVY